MRYCQEKGIVCQYAGTNMHCRLSACIFPEESLYPIASKGEHLMDIEKLIEQLNGYFEGKDLKRCVALDTATALSTLQAENEKLRAELGKQLLKGE